MRVPRRGRWAFKRLLSRHRIVFEWSHCFSEQQFVLSWQRNKNPQTHNLIIMFRIALTRAEGRRGLLFLEKLSRVSRRFRRGLKERNHGEPCTPENLMDIGYDGDEFFERETTMIIFRLPSANWFFQKICCTVSSWWQTQLQTTTDPSSSDDRTKHSMSITRSRKWSYYRFAMARQHPSAAYSLRGLSCFTRLLDLVNKIRSRISIQTHKK